MNCWPEDSKLKCVYIVLSALGLLPLIVVYPFLLILVKFISIFHHGQQWKRLDQYMTLFEGQLEGYLQVILQTYIICRRADRIPSLIQKSGSSMPDNPNFITTFSQFYLDKGSFNNFVFCCPALELFHCLPLWKTVLFVSSRAYSLSTPPFLLWLHEKKSYK